jgi:Flp pilus assembly pilin Flp
MISRIKTTVAQKDEGATALEYVLLIVFVAFLLVAGMTLFGTAVNGAFEDAGTVVESEVPGDL